MAIAHPLAYCPTCKIAFPVAPQREGGTVVFQNSTTNCPSGHFARILNSHYQHFETEIRATLGGHGRAARKTLLPLWERLSRREIAPEQAQAEAERTQPALGSIFRDANLSDPTKKAILDALLADLAARPGPDAEPPTVQQDVTANAAPMPGAAAPREIPAKRKGGNRAFQRSLRHKQRLLMNPRAQ